MADATPSLLIADLRERYRTGRTTPAAVIGALVEAASGADDRHVWIARLSRDAVLAYVHALDPADLERLPLYGIPFVIKDNIDLAGVPTTAGCPAFAYTPTESAFAVRRLVAAGAIPLGKTNLDQFATGLVGTRSPYGACRNAIDPEFIAGGSSSGSAVAVAGGLASFSLGTDTAGSGRVPAAFNNIVGLKPSNGLLSTRGVVPACRSLDCISIFALTAADAASVLQVAAGYDAADPYSRAAGAAAAGAGGHEASTRFGGSGGLAGLRVGVPRPEDLQFFGDAEYERLFAATVARLESLGGRTGLIDFTPFLEAARMLYGGPWIAERYLAVGAFIDANPSAVHPVTRQIIEGGKRPSAAAAFQAAYALKALERRSQAAWDGVDCILTPTAGTIYRLQELEADPLGPNANLGYYTNFMNLFDLCGVAVPAGFRADGLPFGVTLVGPRGADRTMLEVAGHLQRALVDTLGAALGPVPAAAVGTAAGTAVASSEASAVGAARGDGAARDDGAPLRAGHLAVAVCGAHMEDLPLNPQLRDRGGYLLAVTATSPHYRLFALPGGPPHRPGLLRVAAGGAAIALEVWALPTAQMGAFVAGIPAPLGIGKIELASGESVAGFLCEGYATAGALDITASGGWRKYLEQTLR